MVRKISKGEGVVGKRGEKKGSRKKKKERKKKVTKK